jgi:hypothetical protein
MNNQLKLRIVELNKIIQDLIPMDNEKDKNNKERI